jgi:octaprenyl-diphosphate synthase
MYSGNIFSLVRPSMNALDIFMQAQVEQFEPEIRSMAKYCLETSGKRLRPTLVFITGWQESGHVVGDLVRLAGVIEMVHLATLVHDDIMDHAEIRRNRRTASREFGPDAAVLLGDTLFCQALHIASHFPTTEVCRMVSESTRRVCAGEIMQTMRRRDMEITLADYQRVIDLKTAELFRISCLMGAMIGGQNAGFTEAANDFGRHLGIAYQMYDDLVDFLGEEKSVGKTLGTDLATGKLTLPLMCLLEKLSGQERNELLSAMREGRDLPLAVSVERMKVLGIASEVARSIDDELAKARSALTGHESCAPVELMRGLTDLLQTQVQDLNVKGTDD